jgi:hypothetical protein
MKLKTPSKTALTEYCLAPWHLRVRWWLAACFYSWCYGLEQSGAESPEQVNPLWRR